MQRLVTDQIFASSLDCAYKCFLQFNGQHGSKSEYQEHTEHFDRVYRIAALASIQAHYTAAEILHVTSLTPPPLTLGKHFVVVERIEVNGLRSDSIALARARKTSDLFEPLFFHRYEEVSLREKFLLAYKAAVVGKATGIVPTHGQIIYGEEFNIMKVSLSTFIAKVEQMVHDIEDLAAQKEQPLFLCPHCDVCEFRTKCHSRAVEEDNMSLLGGMRRGHIKEQNKKGIFTLYQFSHTFRPRRTPKRAKNPAKPRHFALQAQALRENKVYIHGTPELPSADPSIYFDIEGIPGRRFYYLIGMLVVSDKNETYQFFWVDEKSQQEKVFIEFCESVAAFPGVVLFHYGNYEVKALREMKDRMGSAHRSLVDQIVKSCHNVLSILHPHCYFPVYSNRLKDVARFLGYEFKAKISSGVGSIVFRERWEKTADDTLKDALIAYNREDCEALRTICRFIGKSTALASAHEKVPGRNEEMTLTESLRRPGEGNRPVFRKAEFACTEFELVNKCAYFDYQRDRVFARTGRPSKKAGSRRVKKTERRASLTTVVSETRRSCTTCGSRKITCEKTIWRWLIDLKYYKTGIGVKKWQPRYLIRKYRCRTCGQTSLSPNVTFDAKSRSIYGHGLICWCVYHNIVGKQPMLQVHRGLRDIFGLNIPSKQTYFFKSSLASHYKPLCEEILATVLRDNVLHVDETPVKLRKTTGYVWVLSSATKVYYLFRDSREGTFLHDLLGTYQGILVSDFFNAYDSLKCRQQKCLIHLMRDINDDLRRNPYDEELRSVAEPFARLLKDIVLTIDRYGLRRLHLHKHVKAAERLCATITGSPFASECASKYQTRFEKYGDRLFTFLHYDGVPWNNNNAEHAVHYFAKLRRFADGTFTRSSIEELLGILTVLQTCEYNRVNPLKFLLSGANQLRWITD